MNNTGSTDATRGVGTGYNQSLLRTNTSSNDAIYDNATSSTNKPKKPGFFNRLFSSPSASRATYKEITTENVKKLPLADVKFMCFYQHADTEMLARYELKIETGRYKNETEEEQKLRQSRYKDNEVPQTKRDLENRKKEIQDQFDLMTPEEKTELLQYVRHENGENGILYYDGVEMDSTPHYPNGFFLSDNE